MSCHASLSPLPLWLVAGADVLAHAHDLSRNWPQSPVSNAHSPPFPRGASPCRDAEAQQLHLGLLCGAAQARSPQGGLRPCCDGLTEMAQRCPLPSPSPCSQGAASQSCLLSTSPATHREPCTGCSGIRALRKPFTCVGRGWVPGSHEPVFCLAPTLPTQASDARCSHGSQAVPSQPSLLAL